MQDARGHGQVTVLKIVEVRSESEAYGEPVNAILRNRDGGPFPKQRYVFVDEKNATKQMEIKNLIYKVVSKNPVMPASRKGERWQEKKSQWSAKNSLTERVERYDYINGIAQINKGNGLGKLLRGDAAKAAIAARPTFRANAKNKVLTTLDTEFETSAKKNQNSSHDPNRLMLVEAVVNKSVVRALFDSKAVRDVMSARLCSELHLENTEADRKLRINEGSEACALGRVHEIPITVENRTCLLNVLVVNDAPFSLFIGCLAMKKMRASKEFDEHIAVFRSGERKNVVQLFADGEVSDDQVSEEFTSDGEMGTESDDSKNDSGESDDDEQLCNELELVV